MNGFERRKEQKKESIRRAAIELFAQYGFNKVSLNDIARKAGVSHVTIYNHFGSKDELVHDVVKTAISGLVAKSIEIMDSDRPFLEKMQLIVFNKAQTAESYQGELMKMAVRDNTQVKQYIEDIWQREINRIIIDLIKEGRKLGYINPEISEEAILYYFEIIRHGAFASGDMLERMKVDANLARDLNNLFLFGLVRDVDHQQ
ncbi:TetR/AcrR family transcriptional regulator [Chloroflexota bacterium]